jgi:hypothetical protein
VLRRMIGVAAVTVAAGVAVAGCAPVKMGSAAIVGDNSVSIAQLNTEAGMLTTAQKKTPPAQGPLTQQQVTQATLTWLINFQISDQLAASNGITVSPAQEQAALNTLVANDKEAAEEQGASASSVTLSGIMIANGIAPNLESDLGRWVAIEDAYVRSANGGSEPTSQSQATTAENAYDHATCEAAKSLSIRVNPQFGRMNYSSVPYSVVAAADTVSRASGAAPSSSPAGLTPAC